MQKRDQKLEAVKKEEEKLVKKSSKITAHNANVEKELSTKKPKRIFFQKTMNLSVKKSEEDI